MKELSIEEKAKRYDEAIERAKKWYDANTNEGYRGIFEDIFPELKESEDERIRKEMIEFFTFEHWDGEAPFSYESAKERIAWLEKQGEQKPAWSEEDDKILKSIIINIENLQFSEDMREKYHHILNANKSYYQIKIDWLKSLKDRYAWKPSEEQMKALDEARSLANNCGEESAFDLRTLYEQLKKLREE